MAEHVGDFSSGSSGSDGGSTSNHGGLGITDQDVKFWKKVKKELKKKWARPSVEKPCADLLETEIRLEVYDTASDSDASSYCRRYDTDLDIFFDESDSESSRDEALDAFQEKVKLLKSLRESIDWKVKKSRRKIYRLLDHSITDWQGRLPSLRDIFEDEEIERLMFDRGDGEPDQVPVRKFIEFAISTGYKDEPKLDEATGKPTLLRITPIHRAARLRYPRAVVELFKIYDRYDANYSDEAGLTHFHLACACGCRDVVEKFLRLGRVDPNVAARKGVRPLHLALVARRDEVAALLLRHGADPNATNANDSTALHEICRSYLDDGFVELFFRINDELDQRVLIDARDKRGRTPLQLAVANLQSKTVDVLLDRGADLSSFVFPSEDYFAEGFDTDDFALTSVSRTLSIVRSLERRGYDLKPSDALTIIKFFYEHGLFRPGFELDAYLRHHKRFAKAAKKSTFAPGLSLRDLLRLPLDAAEIVLEAMDYSRFDDLTQDWRTLLRDHVPCTLYLCEIMSSEFVRRWPREFYRYIFLNKK